MPPPALWSAGCLLKRGVIPEVIYLLTLNKQEPNLFQIPLEYVIVGTAISVMMLWESRIKWHYNRFITLWNDSE